MTLHVQRASGSMERAIINIVVGTTGEGILRQSLHHILRMVF